MASLPEVNEIQRWKATYMDIWATTIDQTNPQEEYSREQYLAAIFKA